MCIPVEIPTVYDATAHAGGMSVHVFGGRMNHDVRPPFKRTAVDRSGEGVVYDQRYTMAVRDTGEFFNVQHFQGRIGDCFSEQGFRVRTERG